MDASLGQRGNFNWRTGAVELEKKKKEGKKPHWMVAKEHGKRKNGSEKRKNKKKRLDDADEQVRRCSWRPAIAFSHIAHSAVARGGAQEGQAGPS